MPQFKAYKVLKTISDMSRQTFRAYQAHFQALKEGKPSVDLLREYRTQKEQLNGFLKSIGDLSNLDV